MKTKQRTLAVLLVLVLVLGGLLWFVSRSNAAEEAASSAAAEGSILLSSFAAGAAFSARVPLPVVMETLSSAEAVSPAGLNAPKRSALVSSKQAALLPETVYTASSPAFCTYRSPVTGFSVPKAKVFVSSAAVTVTVTAGSARP